MTWIAFALGVLAGAALAGLAGVALIGVMVWRLGRTMAAQNRESVRVGWQPSATPTTTGAKGYGRGCES